MAGQQLTTPYVLPPREIAARLGLSDAVARKRVSRGLELLRRNLDRRYGDRASWFGAFGLLAFGDAWPRMAASVEVAASGHGAARATAREVLPSTLPVDPVSVTGSAGATASAGVAGSLVGLLVMKKLLVVGAFAAALSFATIRAFDGDRDANALAPASEEDGVALEPASEREPSTTVDDASASTERQAVLATETIQGDSAAGVAAIGPRLFVVDAAGAPARGARAAWIAPTTRVSELVLDAEASGVLPTDGDVVVGAPGFATCSARVDASGADLVLALEPLAVLRGRLEVDGGPPPRPVEIRRRSDGPYLPLSTSDEVRGEQLAVLLGLQLSEDLTACTTTADGSFVFEGVHPRDEGELYLPDSYRRVGSDEAHGWSYRLPAGELVLRARRLPYLFGRMVWADDRAPVEGRLTAYFSEAGTGIGYARVARIEAGGYFEIGFQPAEESPSESPSDTPRLLHSAVVIDPEPASGACSECQLRFELPGHTLPWDVGVIELERARQSHLVVLDDLDRPIAGADVYTDDRQRARTDESGQASLPTAESQWIEVVAEGFALRRLAIDPFVASESSRSRVLSGAGRTDDPTAGESRSSAIGSGETIVHLEPGAALRVSAPTLAVDPELRSTPTLVLEFEPRMFCLEGEGLEEASERLSNLGIVRHRGRLPRLLRSPTAGANWDWRFGFRGEPIVLAPLPVASEFDVRLEDAFGNELCREHVRLPREPGTTELRLAPARAGSLTVRVVDESGRPIEDARVMAHREGIGGSSQRTKGGSLTLAPTGVGSFDLRVQARGFADAIEGGELDGTDTGVEIVLRRAHALELRFEDERGEPCSPDWAVLRSFEGWSSGRLWQPPAKGRRIEDVPEVPLEALVRLGTRTWRAPLEVVAGKALLRLPPAGRLTVRLDERPTPAGAWGELVLTLRERELDAPPTDDLSGLDEWILSGYPEGEARLEESYTLDAIGALEMSSYLLPGQYSIELTARLDVEESAPTRTLMSSDVRIVAGEVLTLDVPR